MIKLNNAKAIALAIACSIALLASQVATTPQPAVAADANNFNAGNIISDAMFYGARMSEADIQAFLVNKGSGLANHRQTTTTKPAGVYSDGGNLTGWGVCSQYDGAVNELASTIIFKVQNACGVSAQALLATLQKESSLVTSGTSVNLRSAMGYGCPDSSDCDSDYYWFFNQMFGAARSFQWYGNQAPGGYSSKKYAVGWWNIQYKPYSSCGTKSVYVENRATAALYYYTPYTPNQASLSNLYGTGDSCSSYGNRNFWRIYTDWFGSTQLLTGSRQFVTAAYYDVLGRAPESQSVIDWWAQALSSGVSRVSVATAFDTSDEYRSKRIREAYQQAFQREPDDPGASFWLSAMKSGYITPDNLYLRLLYSDEYYLNRGGATNTGFVSVLYSMLLNRAPDQAGLAFWVSALDNGVPRESIARGIWGSTESGGTLISAAFTKYLGRLPGPSEQPFWNDLLRDLGPSALRIHLMSSDEYWQRAYNRF